MKTTPQNSQKQPTIETSGTIRKSTSKKHYPRRDFYFSLFYPDVDQTFQVVNSDSSKCHEPAHFFSEYDEDKESGGREILDPENEDQEREFPNQHDDEDINPNRYVPEEDNNLTEDDSSVILEPTREIDDPYRPGHGGSENFRPMEKEFSNEEFEENIKTDF